MQSQQKQGNHNQPLCLAFGSYHQFFTSDQAAKSTPESRILSIWPYICNKVREFTATLTARELCNFDEEDILLEVWIAIRERDDKWLPERGHYMSFAGPIVRHCLYELREHTRTIKSATNASSRLRKFEEEARDGVLSKAKRRTMESMRRSINGPDDLTNELTAECSPDAEIIEREKQRQIVLAVTDIVRQISYEEASVIGPYLGLWGQETKSFAEIACKLGKSCALTKKTYALAIERLSKQFQKTT